MSASRAIERKLLTHILVALLVPTETILAADAPKQSAAPNAQDSTSLPNEQLDSASCRLSQTATVSITTQEAKIVFDRSGNLRFVGELAPLAGSGVPAQWSSERRGRYMRPRWAGGNVPLSTIRLTAPTQP